MGEAPDRRKARPVGCVASNAGFKGLARIPADSAPRVNMIVVGTMRQHFNVPARPGEGSRRAGGPEPALRDTIRLPEGRFIAFLGGSETCARRVVEPYPALLERELGEVCLNLGRPNASVEAALRDPAALLACRQAALTVVAVTGAGALSNRLYSVHPRRNDRFTRPSDALRTLMPEVDFTEICFTRHLLGTLKAARPDRFGHVRAELRTAWTARMRVLLDTIGPRVVLLWFAPFPPPEEETAEASLGPDPLFVSASMLRALRPLARATVVVPPAASDKPLDEAAHARAAAALLGPIRSLLPAEEERAVG